MQTPFISLGSEQLSSALLSEVDVVQRLNDHWTCRIVLRDTPDRRPPVEDYAGKELKISTTELDGTETIIFHGLVRGMRLIYEITGAWGAELEAVSATWKMAQGTRLRYLRQQSAQAAAQAIVSGAGLQMGGAMPAGATLSYVQWDETDYSFFARLVDDAEAWFRPAVDGSGGLDVETAFQSGTAVNWREGEYGLLEWTTQGQLQPITASGANYDPQKMQSTVVGGTASTVAWYGGAAEGMVAAAQSASGSVEPAWVDRHRSASNADLTTRMQREARRGIANTVRCTGISRNPKVRAGDTLQVTGLPGVDATYGVIEAKHVWSTQGYENHFTVTPAQRWSPPARPARPMLDGVYPARVVDNHDPHNQGRIRVQYYWQEDGQSTWVRLLTPHAGAGRGTLFLPELGDEVLVTFEEGDAERPYVVGSAWNGVHQPPATGFHSPGEVNGSEFAQNYIKRIVTKSGHRITLVDTPGKETISIATPTSNRIMLTESHADTGGRPAIVLESAGDIVMAAPNGRIHTQSMHRSAEVGVTGAVKNNAAKAAAPAATAVAKAAATVPKLATPAVDQKKQTTCAKSAGDDKALAANATARAGQIAAGAPAAPWCKEQAKSIGSNADRFARYTAALPAARAASHVNELGDKPGSKAGSAECVTRLPDDAKSLNQKLGLQPGTITDEMLQDNKTGFRAAVYQNDADGSLMLVPRDTEPHSQVDWKTNTDNGQGALTEQYQSMQTLTKTMKLNGVSFDNVGYSKGGGLAQEAGLINTEGKTLVFNSAGIPLESQGRAAGTSLDALARRTTAFSSEGDFLTYVNQTTDPTQQVRNASWLYSRLSSPPLSWSNLHPIDSAISLDYNNPATKGTNDPSFADVKSSYLSGLKSYIDKAAANPASLKDSPIFPPVRAASKLTVPNSMSALGSMNNAIDPISQDPEVYAKQMGGKLVQHQMSNVLSGMEKTVNADRSDLNTFDNYCK